MRQLLLTFFAVVSFALGFCQSPPKQTNASQGKIIVKGKDIRERLVQLAMQNPNAEIDDRNIEIADQNLKKAKTNILNNLVVQFNINEYSINKSTQVYSSNQYPRYNIGLYLPMGLITTRSHDIKIAEQGVGITEAQKNENTKILREAVLSKYEDYLMYVDLLNFQRQVVEDVYSNFQQMEKKFSEAKIQPGEYTNAYRDYNEELGKQRRLERDLNVVVIGMEKLIGTRFEDILKEYK